MQRFEPDLKDPCFAPWSLGVAFWKPAGRPSCRISAKSWSWSSALELGRMGMFLRPPHFPGRSPGPEVTLVPATLIPWAGRTRELKAYRWASMGQLSSPG